MSKIEEAMDYYYGPRCDDPMEGCGCCEAWHELDTLMWRAGIASEPKPLGKWEDEE